MENLDEKLTYSKSYGNPNHFFENLYYENRWFARHYVSANLLEMHERTEVYIPDNIEINILNQYGITIDKNRGDCNAIYKICKDEEEAVEFWLKFIKEQNLDIDEEYPKKS